MKEKNEGDVKRENGKGEEEEENKEKEAMKKKKKEVFNFFWVSFISIPGPFMAVDLWCRRRAEDAGVMEVIALVYARACKCACVCARACVCVYAWVCYGCVCDGKKDRDGHS